MKKNEEERRNEVEFERRQRQTYYEMKEETTFLDPQFQNTSFDAKLKMGFVIFLGNYDFKWLRISKIELIIF